MLSLYYSPVHIKKFQAIVPLLENLCSFEETVVREAACDSLVHMSEKLSEEENNEVIVPAILRLTEAQSFTNRVSALHIISQIYEKTGEYRSTLRK